MSETTVRREHLGSLRSHEMQAVMSEAERPMHPVSASFDIVLAWSDRTLVVGPDQSALDVMAEAGLPVEIGCRTGGCGECVTAYVEGDVIHKDSCLQAAERDRYFCPCVSRARTRIVIAA